jgi:hypothetical protein
MPPKYRFAAHLAAASHVICSLNARVAEGASTDVHFELVRTLISTAGSCVHTGVTHDAGSEAANIMDGPSLVDLCFLQSVQQPFACTAPGTCSASTLVATQAMGSTVH